MNKTYTVFRLTIANKLVDMGFKCVATGINFKNPKYRVFHFENSEELQKVIKELVAQK